MTHSRLLGRHCNAYGLRSRCFCSRGSGEAVKDRHGATFWNVFENSAGATTRKRRRALVLLFLRSLTGIFVTTEAKIEPQYEILGFIQLQQPSGRNFVDIGASGSRIGRTNRSRW
jgi:hypothetical protein